MFTSPTFTGNATFSGTIYSASTITAKSNITSGETGYAGVIGVNRSSDGLRNGYIQSSGASSLTIAQERGTFTSIVLGAGTITTDQPLTVQGGANSFLKLTQESANHPSIQFLDNAGAIQYGTLKAYDFTFGNGTTNFLTLANTTGNATFSGDITVNSGHNYYIAQGDLVYSSNLGYGILSQDLTRAIAIQNSGVTVNDGLTVNGNATFGGSVTVVGANINLTNAYYLASKTVSGTTVAMLGMSATDKISLDPNGYGVVIGNTLQVNGNATFSGSGTFSGAVTTNNYFSSIATGDVVNLKSASSNYSNLVLGVSAGGINYISSSKSGSGAYLPIKFFVSDLEAIAINTDRSTTFSGGVQVNGLLAFGAAGTFILPIAPSGTNPGTIYRDVTVLKYYDSAGSLKTISTTDHTHNYNANVGITSLDASYLTLQSGELTIASSIASQWNSAYTNSHTHSNKTTLDGISAGNITNWGTAYDRSLTSISFANGTLTLNKQDNTELHVSLDGRYLTSSSLNGYATQTWVGENYATASAYGSMNTRVTALELAGYLTSESDPTVPSWAKQSTKPSYTYSEVGAAASSHSHNYNANVGITSLDNSYFSLQSGELTLTTSVITSSTFWWDNLQGKPTLAFGTAYTSNGTIGSIDVTFHYQPITIGSTTVNVLTAINTR